MTEAKAKIEKLTTEATKLGQDNLSALTQSSNIFIKGMESIVQTLTTLAQSSAERNAQAAKTLMAAKTLNEFTENGNKIAQANLDAFLGGLTKVSELSVKLATESFSPINDQLNKTVKKVSEAA